MAIQQASVSRGGTMTRAPRPSNLAEVLDLILDKGIVIDAYVRVSVIGIELITVDLRVVVDTYLRFAEAVNRLDLEQVANNMTLEDLQGKGARSMGERKGRQALDRVKEKVTPGGASSGEKDADQGGERSRERNQDDGERSDDEDSGKEGGGIRGMVSKVAERAKWS